MKNGGSFAQSIAQAHCVGFILGLSGLQEEFRLLVTENQNIREEET